MQRLARRRSQVYTLKGMPRRVFGHGYRLSALSCAINVRVIARLGEEGILDKLVVIALGDLLAPNTRAHSSIADNARTVGDRRSTDNATGGCGPSVQGG